MVPPPAEVPTWVQLLLSSFAGLGIFVAAIWGYVKKQVTPPAREGEAMVIAGAIADKAAVDRLITAMEKLERHIETMCDVVRNSGDRHVAQADRIHAIGDELCEAVKSQAAATTNLLNFIQHRH